MIRKKLYWGNSKRALEFLEKIEPIDTEMKIITESMTINAHSVLCVLSLDPEKVYTIEVKGDTHALETASTAISAYVI